METNYNVKKQKNIIGIIAGAVIAISVFLPCAKISVWGMSISVKFMDGSDGYIFLALAIAGIVLSVLGKDLIVLILGAASTLISIYEIVNFNNLLGNLDSDFFDLSDLVSKGIGFYLLIIGSIALLVAGILPLLNKKSTPPPTYY